MVARSRKSRARWVGGGACLAAALGISVLALGRKALSEARQGPVLPQLKPPPLAVQAGGQPRYVFRAAPGVVSAATRSAPDKLPVYTVLRERPTRDAVCELLKDAGVSVLPEFRALMPPTDKDDCYRVTAVGELVATTLAGGGNVTQDDNYVAAVLGRTNASRLVKLDVLLTDSGNFTLALRGGEPRPEDEAPTDAESQLIAEAFLQSFRGLPEGLQFERVEAARSTTVGDASSDTVRERPISKEATYTRYLGGFRDGSLTVRVNGKGEVYSVRRNARNISPLADYPILTAEEAVESLGSGRGTVSAPNLPGDTLEAVIQKIDLVYDEGALAWSYDTLQPMYRFEGSVAGSHDGFWALVPAVRPEYLTDDGAAPKWVSGGGAIRPTGDTARKGRERSR